jgi:hypothetical protein
MCRFAERDHPDRRGGRDLQRGDCVTCGGARLGAGDRRLKQLCQETAWSGNGESRKEKGERRKEKINNPPPGPAQE